MSESKFTKNQLVSSFGYSQIEKDILKIELKKDKEYTATEVKKILADFKGGLL